MGKLLTLAWFLLARGASLPIIDDFGSTSSPVANPPLQVYRHNKDRQVVSWVPASQLTPISDEAPPNSMDVSSTFGLPIALRKRYS